MDFSGLPTLYFKTFLCSWFQNFMCFFTFHSRVCCGFLKSWNLPQGYFVCAYCKTHPEGWTEITWRLFIISETLHPGPTPVWVLSAVPRSQLCSESSPPSSLPLPTALGDSAIQISPLLFSLPLFWTLALPSFFFSFPCSLPQTRCWFFPPIPIIRASKQHRQMELLAFAV